MIQFGELLWCAGTCNWFHRQWIVINGLVLVVWHRFGGQWRSARSFRLDETDERSDPPPSRSLEPPIGPATQQRSHFGRTQSFRRPPPSGTVPLRIDYRLAIPVRKSSARPPTVPSARSHAPAPEPSPSDVPAVDGSSSRSSRRSSRNGRLQLEFEICRRWILAALLASALGL